MKKSLLVIAALVVLALLVTPNLVGGGIQRATVGALLEMVPDDASAMLDIQQTAFERGWFNSRAQIEVRLAELDQLTGEPVALLLDLAIQHGPLLFTPQGFRMGAAYAMIDPQLRGLTLQDLEPAGELDSSEPYFYLFTGFNNTAELGLELAQLSATNPDAQLSLQGLQGTSLILADLSSEISLALESTSLTATNGQFDLSVDNLNLSGEESDVSRPFSPGQSSLTVARLSSSAPLPFALNRISADYRLAPNPALPDSRDFSQLFSIESIEWDMPVQSINWQVQLSGVSGDLLDSYAELISQSDQTGNADPAQVTETLTGLGQEFALRLGREDFNLDSTLALNAFQGDHRLELSVAWPGLENLVSLESLDFREVLAAVNVQLLFDGDEAALMNSPFAQTVVDYRALLTVENGRVQALITLADSELNINGDILPLEQFVNNR